MTPEPERRPSCEDPVLRDALPVADALARILGETRIVEKTEVVPLEKASNRILAESLPVRLDVPPRDNSAVDGYALRAADIPREGGRRLVLRGTALAGHPYAAAPIEPGTCIRITTGAPLPEGIDTVVMQEHCEVDGDGVLIGASLRPGANTRKAGEDLRRGDTLLPAGSRIGPAELGLIASQGYARVNVYLRPRVAVFSTGDEICLPGGTPGPGQIHDSNRYTLLALLNGLDADILDLGILPDEPAAVRQALESAAASTDAVITSGGVSVGEADHVKTALAALGSVEFWKVAMKPGRPLAFGRLGQTLFFGLPGNPVAVMVTFLQFVRPALQRLAGQSPETPWRISAISDVDLRKRPGRTEYQRGIMSRGAQGELHVRPWGPDGSGILRSMHEADCFIVLDHEAGPVRAGEQVDVQPFAGLM